MVQTPGMATTSPLALLCGASDHVGLGLRVDGLEHRIEGFRLQNFTYGMIPYPVSKVPIFLYRRS